MLFWSVALWCYVRGSIVTVEPPPPASSPVDFPVVAPPSFVLPEVVLPVKGPVERLDPQPDVPRSKFLCGRPTQDRRAVAIVACGPEAPLVGMAWSPPNECTSIDIAVTRGDGYSICWFSFDLDLEMPHMFVRPATRSTPRRST